jgi:hypothetical protein
MTAAKMRAAILHHLPGLEPYLGDGRAQRGEPVGFRLMFTESQILLAALARLMAQGVVALPLHDAVLVRRDHAEIARRELEAVALGVCGVAIPANVKA